MATSATGAIHLGRALDPVAYWLVSDGLRASRALVALAVTIAVLDSTTPVRIRHSPRLMLVARDFHGRTGSAFEFLIEHGLPLKLIRVSLYEDLQQRRFVDVEGEHEPQFPTEGPEEGALRRSTRRRSRANGFACLTFLTPVSCSRGSSSSGSVLGSAKPTARL
jgi:hypothetical protein